jgi:hypothetical protein
MGLQKLIPTIIPPLFMGDMHAATQHFCLKNEPGTWGHRPRDGSKEAPPRIRKTKICAVPLTRPGHEDATSCDTTK